LPPLLSLAWKLNAAGPLTFVQALLDGLPALVLWFPFQVALDWIWARPRWMSLPLTALLIAGMFWGLLLVVLPLLLALIHGLSLLAARYGF
jgi:hypothetical protein